MSELLKLILILGSGIVVIIIGVIFQVNVKKVHNNTNLNSIELKAKEYIEQYKSHYPKNSIKLGLKNMGINDNDSEMYLNKYF